MNTISLEPIDVLLEPYTSTIGRDLKLNLARLLQDGALTTDEALLATLAVSTSLGYREVSTYARQQLSAAGLSQDEIQEAEQSAAMMGMLNVYYRFRHFVGSPA